MKRFVLVSLAALAVAGCDRDALGPADMAGPLFSTTGSTLPMTDLGTLGGTSSTAADINDAGHIVGSSKTASGQTHAFLWQNGTMIDLGTLGGANSEAVGINRHGQIVGWSEDASGQTHLFLWQNGIMTALTGSLYGNNASINDNGEVAGTSLRRATVWRNGTATAVGGDFTRGSGINDDGKVVGQSSRQWMGGRRHHVAQRGYDRSDRG